MIRFIKWLFGFNRKEGERKDRIYREINEKTKNKKHQEQTNKLANLFNIFGGSRLPEDPNDLIKQGWKDITHPEKRKNHMGRTYKNKYTKQEVNFDYGNINKDGFKRKNHYHWKNIGEEKNIYPYIDKYGNLCRKNSKESHILPIIKKRGTRK